MCAFTFEEKKTYLVFVSEFGGERQVSICSPSAEFSDATETIGVLNELFANKR